MSILKNKVTRQAILFTLLIFIIYRLGFYVYVPLVNVTEIKDLGAIGGLISALSGGNLLGMTIFALGVSPYITASIVIQLLENDLIPSVSEWKHQGVEGQNKRANWTKYLAVTFSFVQAFGIILYFYRIQSIQVLVPISGDGNASILEYVLVALFITTGTTILMWLADRITEKGVGNGMSILIMAGILARMPTQLIVIGQKIYGIVYNEVKGISSSDWIQLAKWGFVFIVFLALIVIIIYYTLAYRRVNINYVKNSKSRLNEQSYIPIKLNPAGVIPIIFVAPLMQLPLLILKLPYFVNNNPVVDGVPTPGPYETVVRALFDYTGDHWYVAIVVYFVLIVIFSVTYSYIQMNPQNMAENLEKQSAYIVGVRPGADTEKYLAKVINKTTIYGGMILAFIAVLPILLTKLLGLTVGLQILGTGLIITVNVLVQTYKSLHNKTESKNYKVLFKTNNNVME